MKTHGKHITPFGGIVPILKQINGFGIPQTIRKSLGIRRKQCAYDYKDIILSWVLTNFCGGLRLDHISEIGRNISIVNKLGLKIPSHDTLGRSFKSLATKTVTKAGKGHHEKVSIGKYNDNLPLNHLLVSATKKTKLLKEGLSYTLDMDSTIIPTECYESNKSYIYENGIHPMVCSIGKLPVFITMRSGNVSPQAEIKETLMKSIDILSKHKIKVGKVRMDSAGYSVNALRYLDEQNIKFYVCGRQTQSVMHTIKYKKKWQPATFKSANRTIKCESTSVYHELRNEKREYRIAVIRTKKNSKKKQEWITEGKYSYKLIITNDFESSEEDIMHFYNQRGSAERNFDVLKNHHGWKYPPFSFLNQNLVFLIIGALSNNIYQAIIAQLNELKPSLKLGNMRLEKFKRKFINAICQYVNGNFDLRSIKIAFEKIA
ncbi:MAG: IS1380 family transposase [Bacteroidetes bacterium]|nr:IS1380 family transposase [Bacteroidota bacterium]